MALNYTSLFENLGEFVARVESFVTLYTTLDGHLGEIQTELSENNRYDVLEGQTQLFQGYKFTVMGWVSAMQAKTTELLTHRSTVLDQLQLGTISSVGAVLPELIRDMNDNGITVKANTVTVGSTSTDLVNANAGTCVQGKVLDGYSSPFPSNGFLACQEYFGLDSELADDDLITLTCITDSMTGASEGSEVWSVEGLPAKSSPYSWEDFGSGRGGTVISLQGQSVLTNCGFDSFSSNVPSGWSIVSGTAGTHIIGDSGQVIGSGKALQFTGDGTQGQISVKQAVTSSRVTPRRRYCVAFHVKGEAGTSAGTLTIQFEGTGYTATSSEKIELDATALSAQTSYGLEYFFINIPPSIPSDFRLVIRWTGTPTSGKSVRVDYGGVQPVFWHNGVHMNVVAGVGKFVKGDRLSFTTVNTKSGKFQNYFRKTYGAQLPSSATPTISDGFVTDKTILIGLASETDIALGLEAITFDVIGLTTETDSTFAVTHKKTKAIGIASETDSAFSVTEA